MLFTKIALRRLFSSFEFKAVVATASVSLVLSKYDTDSVNQNRNNIFQQFIRPLLFQSYCSAATVEIKEEDIIIANGFHIDPNMTPSKLPEDQKKKFALLHDSLDYTVIDKSNFSPNKVLVYSKTQLDNRNQPLPSIITTTQLLTPEQCEEWIKRGETITFDESDFIYKTGKWGIERMATGGRRSSATRLIEDKEFSERMTAVCKEIAPSEINGRKYLGTRKTFLISRYQEGQYFAPHYDGCGKDIDAITGQPMQSEYTVVLYLTDNFEGGGTHYIPATESDVLSPISVKPPRGYGVMHKGLTVMHAGGKVLQGTKYIMQFGLMYEKDENSDEHLKPLRWGA